jgi:hypothetical protein
MIFEAFQIRFQQPKYPLGMQCVHSGSSHPDYEPLLPAHQATRFGNMRINAAEVVLERHNRLTASAASTLPPAPRL